MKLLATIALIICVKSNLYAQFGSPYESNYYDIISKLDALLPPEAPVEDHPRTEYYRWMEYWGKRLHPTGDFNIYRSAISQYNNDFSNQYRISNSIQANWNHLGPSVPTGSIGGPGGVGRATCIEFHPTNNNIIFAGTWGGGVWKTVDGGLSWSNLNTDYQLPQLGISVIEVDPNNSNYIYVGSGTSGKATSIGVYRSSDGGNTWVAVNSGLAGANGNYFNIEKLLIDPSNSDVLYAATDGGLFKTTNATTNCSWNLLNTGQWYLYNLLFGANSQTIYACGSQTTPATAGAPASDIIVSNNGGATWTSIGIPSFPGMTGEFIYRINMDGVYSGGNLYLYALITTQTIATQTAKRFVYFYNGTTWSLKHTFLPGSDMWLGDNRLMPIAVSPTNPATDVFMGSAYLYYSVDGGLTFGRHSYGIPCHADLRHLMFQPGTNALYIATDGGVCLYQYTKNPYAYTHIYRSNGLEIATSQNISSFSMVNPDRDLILSGMFDDGSVLYDSNLPLGQQWTYESSGDGFEQIIDYNDYNNLYSTSNGPGQNGNGVIYRSYNSGISWTSVTNTAEPCLFGAPLAIDSKTPTTLYQGRTNVWRTDDKWQTKYKISDFNNENGTGLYDVSIFTGVAPNYPNYIYNITAGWPSSNTPYRLFKTTTGGNINWQTNQWSEITPPIPTAASGMTAVAVSDKNPNHIWVSYSGFNPSYRVKQSTDGGLNWIDYNTGLPVFPINHIVYERGSNDGLYIATDVGIYYRNKYMTQWEPFNNNLPNVECSWLDVNTQVNKIRVGTWGRGIWQSHLNCPDDLDLALSGIHPNYFFEAENNLTSTASVNVGIDVIYRAGNSIELLPDFLADAGSTFNAYIHPCNTSGNSFRTVNPAFTIEDFNIEADAQSRMSYVENKNDLLVYPNPNTGDFNVILPSNDEIEKILICDLTGRIIRVQHATSFSRFEKGTYIVQAIGKLQRYTKRVVIN